MMVIQRWTILLWVYLMIVNSAAGLLQYHPVAAKVVSDPNLVLFSKYGNVYDSNRKLMMASTGRGGGGGSTQLDTRICKSFSRRYYCSCIIERL